MEQRSAVANHTFEIEKLFLSYYSGDAAELYPLASELRLRGIAPWVDKQGGFKVGDEAEPEARRAIRQDCSGLLLYATRDALTRPFIRDVELDEARRVHAVDPSFVLTAVPRGIGFRTLGEARDQLGVDLSAFHGIPIRDEHVDDDRRAVANGVLERALGRAASRVHGSVWLQFSTRECLPDEPDDVLRIDAVDVVADPGSWPAAWDRVLRALIDVKRQLWRQLPIRHVSVHGSKHLTAAFLFGRVFARYDLEIRQTMTDWWGTAESDTDPADPLVCACQVHAHGSGPLVVEVASRFKHVALGVDHLLAETGLTPITRLQCRPATPPLDVDAALCRAMARQVYEEIERAMRAHHVTGIHLFAAAPQAFMMMLGQRFSGMPPVQLYEWTGTGYIPSCIVPGGVL